MNIIILYWLLWIHVYLYYPLSFIHGQEPIQPFSPSYVSKFLSIQNIKIHIENILKSFRWTQKANFIHILIWKNWKNISLLEFVKLLEASVYDKYVYALISLVTQTCKAFLPGMIERNHGHVVNIASSAGLIGVNGLADYCASKFGAVGFDESLRMELAMQGKNGVHTTVVCPYFISTGMFEGAKTRYDTICTILKDRKLWVVLVLKVLDLSFSTIQERNPTQQTWICYVMLTSTYM